MVPADQAMEATVPVIPLATTTVDVQVATETEPGEGRTFTTRHRDVAAHISAPTGTETPAPGGGRQTITATFLLDHHTDLANTDRLVDHTTGITWEVDTAVPRVGLGLDHVHGTCHYVQGPPT